MFFAFIAGLLSTLSPCVLPLLPLVLGAATSQHKFGPAALAGGLAISFTVIGLFVATIGFSIGLDGALFRDLAALMLVAVGTVLVIPPLQIRLAAAGGPISDWADRRLGGFNSSGLQGQFGVGLLLGAVWTPCVGPTLGAASVLAARGENLLQVAFTMAVFGIGAALPLLALGTLSREAMLRWRNRLMRAGQGGKAVLGGLLVLIGVLILTNLDKRLETTLLDASPEWLVRLTTQF
jgi:cytochrome c-type biogenesis protein